MWNFYNPIQRVNQIGSWMVGVERDVLCFLFVIVSSFSGRRVGGWFPGGGRLDGGWVG